MTSNPNVPNVIPNDFLPLNSNRSRRSAELLRRVIYRTPPPPSARRRSHLGPQNDMVPPSNSSIPSTHLMSFHLFPSLPTELRLKIYNHIANLTSSRRILKISHSPMLERYTSNTAPPLILSLSAEARAWAQTQYSYLSLGPSSNSWSNPRLDPSAKPWSSDAKLPVPICYATDTLYISGLSPLFPSQLSNTLYHLSTSGSRHWIQSLAVDLRVWNELCENGFLGVLGRMKGLREVLLVLEFGRNFRGELGFLEAPEWRMDLGWIAGNAGKELESERDRARGIMKENKREEKKESVSVRCVILTRGGEQA